MENNSKEKVERPPIHKGDKPFDRAMRAWQEGNSRIQSWFVEKSCQPDDNEFLAVVLKYVTDLFDNTGHCNRFIEIWAPEHIEERYLPHLRSVSYQLVEVSKGYAKRRCEATDLEGYLAAVRIRLESRLHHWEAEALAYLRQREIAINGPGDSPRFSIEMKWGKLDFAEFDEPPEAQSRIIEGAERIRAKWFAGLAEGKCDVKEFALTVSAMLDLHAENYLLTVVDEDSCQRYCELISRAGEILLRDAFDGHPTVADARGDAQLRLESRSSHWRAEAQARLRQTGQMAPATAAGGEGKLPLPHTVPQTDASAPQTLVDHFLLRCSQELAIEVGKMHIWGAVGHTKPRQFQYWQAGTNRGPGSKHGATRADDRNFRRILAMEPKDFAELLKKKGIS